MTQPAMAVAVFVKTPGLSPIKTRLASDVGAATAAEFYRLALAAVEATVTHSASSDVCPYWAVAEQAGMTDVRWCKFDRVDQGTGTLAARLGRVFDQLQARHSIVAVLGVDSPQVSAARIQDALSELSRHSTQPTHVLGRCHDGGFYIVGSNRIVSPGVWHDVPFSAAETADRLADMLAELGSLVELPRLTDVDRAADLPVLRRELELLTTPTAEQLALLKWVKDFCDSIRVNPVHCNRPNSDQSPPEIATAMPRRPGNTERA